MSKYAVGATLHCVVRSVAHRKGAWALCAEAIMEDGRRNRRLTEWGHGCCAEEEKCDPHGTAIPKKPPGTNGTHGHQQAGVVHQLLQFDAVDGWANGI
uniref:Uncharacterized protein n=1 Tax=Oryza meridionalis TaxID=40149 RepID=A0A0E0CSB5_9ORYZ